MAQRVSCSLRTTGFKFIIPLGLCVLCLWLFVPTNIYRKENISIPVSGYNAPLPGSSVISSVRQYKNSVPQTKILQWDGNKWIDHSDFCIRSTTIEKVPYKTPIGLTPIYIHSLKDDKWVSGSLKKTGKWDPSNVNIVYEYLRRDPEMGLLDLGCQLGTFTLVAAKMGRQVVCVDPLHSNVERLCRSVQAGNFTDKVTIFFNPLSDNHQQISFIPDQGNIGGTSLNKNNVEYNPRNDSVNTILLDELLPVIKFKKAFIKMDVQQHEHFVLRGGMRLLKELDIKGILMEWVLHYNEGGRKLKEFMIEQGFKPFTNTLTNPKPLIDIPHTKWPYDLLWFR